MDFLKKLYSTRVKSYKDMNLTSMSPPSSYDDVDEMAKFHFDLNFFLGETQEFLNKDYKFFRNYYKSYFYLYHIFEIQEENGLAFYFCRESLFYKIVIDLFYQK